MQQVSANDDLTGRLRKGDKRAVSQFVDQYGGFLYNVCHKILLSRPEAEEAAQDAMLKVLKAIETFDDASSFKAWCYTIAYRTAIDHQRKMRPTSDADSLAFVAAPNHADDGLVHDEMREGINSLLRHLDAESRSVIALFYLEEKNIKEITEVTGLTESNIKIKLFRARKELAIHVRKYFEQT